MSVAVRPWKRGGEEIAGRWQVDIRFKRPDGTKHRSQAVVEAGSRTQAKKWGLSKEARLRDGSLVPEAKAIPSFKTFVDDTWWPTYPTAAGNSHTTISEKKGHLRMHLTPFFGGMRLDRIDKREMDRFVAHMATKTVGKEPKERKSRNGTLAAPRPLSPKRVKNVLGTLHTILMSAHEWGVLSALPKFPKIKHQAPTFDFYNVHEAALLVEAARDAEERALIRFALHTGARAGEQMAVEWTDIDGHSKFATFSKSRTNGVTRASTKGRKARKVPLSEAVLADLRAVRHAKGSLVFCQADGSPLTLWILHDHLARAARKAKLRLLRWHDLRHSFASNLTIAGTPIRQVQEWMGHSTVLMTMRYSHLAPGGGREYLAGLEAPPPPPRHSRAAE